MTGYRAGKHTVVTMSLDFRTLDGICQAFEAAFNLPTDKVRRLLDEDLLPSDLDRCQAERWMRYRDLRREFRPPVAAVPNITSSPPERAAATA